MRALSCLFVTQNAQRNPHWYNAQASPLPDCMTVAGRRWLVGREEVPMELTKDRRDTGCTAAQLCGKSKTRFQRDCRSGHNTRKHRMRTENDKEVPRRILLAEKSHFYSRSGFTTYLTICCACFNLPVARCFRLSETWPLTKRQLAIPVCPALCVKMQCCWFFVVFNLVHSDVVLRGQRSQKWL